MKRYHLHQYVLLTFSCFIITVNQNIGEQTTIIIFVSTTFLPSKLIHIAVMCTERFVDRYVYLIQTFLKQQNTYNFILFHGQTTLTQSQYLNKNKSNIQSIATDIF